MTSLVFMFEEVPDPVWKTSTTNWSCSVPSITSWAAAAMPFACSPVMTPLARLTTAALALIWPRAVISAGGIG